MEDDVTITTTPSLISSPETQRLTLNDIAETLNVSRYKVIKASNDLALEPEIKIRKSVKIQLYTTDQVSSIAQHLSDQLNARRTSKTSKKTDATISVSPSLLEELSAAKSSSEHTLLLQEISSLKAQVELLVEDKNYLKLALEREQENSKILSNQLSNQDARLGVVLAALSQNQPKELTEKEPEKKSFWQRVFG
jgi:hypothetical protein